jgi:hypothetical protein
MRHSTNFKMDYGWPRTTGSTVRSASACERDVEILPVYMCSTTRLPRLDLIRQHEAKILRDCKDTSRVEQDRAKGEIFVTAQDTPTCGVHRKTLHAHLL